MELGEELKQIIEKREMEAYTRGLQDGYHGRKEVEKKPEIVFKSSSQIQEGMVSNGYRDDFYLQTWIKKEAWDALLSFTNIGYVDFENSRVYKNIIELSQCPEMEDN